MSRRRSTSSIPLEARSGPSNLTVILVVTRPVASRLRAASGARTHLASIAETQPQLQPALLRLSAMISQSCQRCPTSIFVENAIKCLQPLGEFVSLGLYEI